MVFVFTFGIFSYYMDAKCDYYTESCRDFIPVKVVVIREGLYRIINYEELVIGDLVSFTDGQQVCADIKIVKCSGVKINISMLNERENYYYEHFYGSSRNLFCVGDILFSSTFIFSGKPLLEVFYILFYKFPL